MSVALRHSTDAFTHRPHLRVVTAKPKSGARRYRQARRNFYAFTAFMLVLSVLGIARVWVSVRATEASFEASELRAELKSEKYEGDMLEVRQSALGSPSRIQAIAGRAMGMAPAGQVTYVDIREPVVSDPAPVEAAATGSSILKRAASVFIELTAGEAEALLVGDVGISTTR